jgi:hypothetical protein
MYQFLSWGKAVDYIVELKGRNLSHPVDMLTTAQVFFPAFLYLQMWEGLFAWVAFLHLTKNNYNIYPTLQTISWILTTTDFWYSSWRHSILFIHHWRWNCYLSLKLKEEMSVWICNCVLHMCLTFHLYCM